MQTSLLAFVWQYSWRQQILLLLLTFTIFPFVYASLEIPKIIINEAIDGTEFPRVIFGVAFDQIPFLLLLCFVFLALVVLINGLKWLLNVGIGMTGERVLRRLRYMLFERVMRFPMKRVRSMRTGETVQSILGEVEPLGGFIGELIATPVFQTGLLTVYVVFIFVQDVWLGLAAIALYPVQAFLIPILQAKIIRLNKERVGNVRDLADRIGEGIGTVDEIRTNDTARWHLAQVSSRLATNTRIRRDIFQRKFTIKLLNNFMIQLTPFFFYSAGGYLVITGRLDFGSLVAVLAAYKDLAGPWKALLNFVQRLTDFRSRFRLVVENFESDDLADAGRVFREDATALHGPLVLEGVTGGAGSEGLRVPRLSADPGQTLALLGGDSGARDALMRIMAGLDAPEAGRVTLGDVPLGDATFGQIGGAIAHVGPRPGMVEATVRENALYGLYRRLPGFDGTITAERTAAVQELYATGSPASEPPAGWIADPDRVGLDDRLLHLTEIAGLDENLYSVALSRHLTADQVDRWSTPLLALRRRLATGDENLADLAEPWTPDAFNANGSLLENLLFGLPRQTPGNPADYLRNPAVIAFLDRSGGGQVLEEIGWDIAVELDMLAEAVREISPLLDRFAAFGRQDFSDATALVAAGGARGIAGLRASDKLRLRALAARFVEVRDQLEVVDEARRARILSARTKIIDEVRKSPDFIALDDEGYNPMRTVADNILNASRRHDRRSEWSRIDALVETAIREEGLWFDLVSIGLDAPLSKANLSINAIRRLALVRAVVKRPNIILLDGLADSDSEADRALRTAIRQELPDVCLVYAANSEAAAEEADVTLRIAPSGEVEAS
ncbi:MAG: ABC transporter transmembrane domain-containing protein [Pseudomonadota bacterium]